MSQFCRFGEADIHDGKVVGLYAPLKLSDSDQQIRIEGETFSYTVSRKSGQIVSARVLGAEYLADGGQMPNPYIGLFPEDDPGASPLGNERTARYGWEKATRIKPPLYSRELTNSPHRFEIADSIDVRVAVVDSGPGFVHVRSQGAYAAAGESCGVRWRIDYEFDVDSFVKIQVSAIPDKPVLLQWHCVLHARLSRQACEYLIPWSDLSTAGVTDSGILAPISVAEQPHGLLYGATLNPFFQLGNIHTGIDFTKERFDDRLAGYRDSGIRLPDGFHNPFDSAAAPDGTMVTAADSRGRRGHLTQIFSQPDAIEIEEFDVRNTTFPLNPGDGRSRYFFCQLLPPKRPREDLNSVRTAWPGPHQVSMVGWAGNREWHPPGKEQIQRWKEAGANLVVGGLHFFDGDAPSATMQEAVRQFIADVHAAGMKIIPYMTFNDFAFAASEYRGKAAEWMYSACIEYRNETMLMCYNAAGWRDNFERQAEWIFSNFDFDGLYIDHWATRRCDNARHGCGNPPFTWVTEGYHDIAKRARKVVARHTAGKGIMLLNSGGDPFTACLGMFDLRLQGENIDLKRVPELDLSLSMNPQRQGAHAVVYPGHWSLSEAFVCFFAAAGFGYRVAEALRREPTPASEMLLKISRLQQQYGCDTARKISTFEREGIIGCSGTGMHVNAFCTPGGTVLLGARLPASNVGTVDRAALSDGIHRAMAAAGLRQGVIDRVIELLQPYYKPLEAEATIDSLEVAVQRARQERSAGTAEARVSQERIELLDAEALMLPATGELRVTDLLDNAQPQLRQRTITLAVRTDQPFMLLVAKK